MKRYVLTGPPGAGKTAVLLYLESQHGEHIVRECAEDVIRMRSAQGVKDPWNESDFQHRILELQLLRERMAPRDTRVFFDRGVDDGLAYLCPGPGTYQRVLDAMAEQRYDHVFFFEPRTGNGEPPLRGENVVRSHELGTLLRTIYENSAYPMTTVPPLPVHLRAKIILETIKTSSSIGDG